MIVAHVLVDKDTGDPGQVDDTLVQVDGVIDRIIIADGAYDGDPVYDSVRRHSPDHVSHPDCRATIEQTRFAH